MPQKNVKVTSKFLNSLANSIYNPKTRRFMKLCSGALQEDQVDDDGNPVPPPLHCGLGELYFAMTGKQPEVTGVSEDDVVDLACELAGFESCDGQQSAAIKAIKALKLSQQVRDELENHIDNMEPEDFRSDKEINFRDALDEIPNRNDGGNVCSTNYEEYRSRACRVATQLRRAAKALQG